MAESVKLHVPEQKILENAKAAVLIGRGKEKLIAYGMNEAYFSTVDEEIANASSFKSNEDITQDLKDATLQKNMKLKEASIWGRQVKTRLKLAFPENPEVLKEFPANWPRSKRDEATMLETIPTINKLIDKYSTALKAKGLPDDHKQKGILIRTEIDTLNIKQEELKKLGPEYTQQRIAAYVKIYDRVNEINLAGREAYADSPAELKAFKSPWPAAEKKTAKAKAKQTA